jgi:hypothetical protein
MSFHTAGPVEPHIGKKEQIQGRSRLEAISIFSGPPGEPDVDIMGGLWQRGVFLKNRIPC